MSRTLPRCGTVGSVHVLAAARHRLAGSSTGTPRPERAAQLSEAPIPTIICVPGLGLDVRAWAPTLAALPTRHGEVALLPGFGLRPGRGEDVRPSSVARRLLADHRADLDGVILAGHSASCHVVVEAALAAPRAVAAIVLVGPTTDPRASSWARLAGRWLRTAAHEPPLQAPHLVRAYTRVGPFNMVRTMDAARRHDLRPALARLSCPVLVVRGRHDRICRLDWVDELTQASPPGSAGASLSAGAHMVPLTHGALVAEQITRFDSHL